MSHVSPFARPRDVGDLLSAAGFNMISIDVDTIKVQYPDMFTLMAHLQAMGDQAAPAAHLRVPAVSRDVFLAAASAYDALYRYGTRRICHFITAGFKYRSVTALLFFISRRL